MANKKQKINRQDKGNKIDYKRNLKEWWGLLKGKKFKLLLITLVVGVVVSLSVFDKYLFQHLIDSASLFSSGDIASVVFMKTALFLLGIYFLFYFVRAIFTWLRFKMLSEVITENAQSVKKKYFSHLLKLDNEFHNNIKTGSLISKYTRGVQASGEMIQAFVFNAVPLIVELMILVPAFLSFGIWHSIILFLMCASFLVYSYIIGVPVYKKRRKVELEKRDRERGNFADFMTNVESVKSFGKESLMIDRYQNLTDETKFAEKKAWKIWGYYDAGQMIIIVLGLIALLYVTINQFILSQITIGQMSFIYTTFIGLWGPLNWFSYGLRNASRTMTDMNDLFQYNEVKNKIKDKSNAKNLKVKDGNIEFKNISFKYPKGERVFENLNLKIPAGKTIALVGHSGCGKSSLVKLLYRFYDVTKGEILIDRKNIKNFKQESLRSEMALVSQEPILFDDTIYNNVLFSNPNASRSEVMKAIKFAQLDKVIKRLPKKEKTIVGERGVKLSGGEKQRVSIARALLANKKVLVLDEATSSLDSETEHDIQKDLQKLMKGKTSIVIAHRLSTIMSADLIVVMEEGKIVEKGTHRELITKGAHYKSLWEFQKGGYLAEE